MNVITLIIALGYILSSRGEKHYWFEGHLYRHQRDNQWRCIQKECNDRFKTRKNSENEEEISDERLSHSCKPIMYEEFMCKKALNRMKERAQYEIHTARSEIYSQECNSLVELGKVPRAIDDLNFDGENFKYTQTTDKMPFLRHYCRDPGSKFLFFASNEGIKLLSDSKRWHSDGTFFAAPKPFKQVYIIHVYTSNGHMLPCAYFLTEKNIAIFIKKNFLHCITQQNKWIGFKIQKSYSRTSNKPP